MLLVAQQYCTKNNFSKLIKKVKNEGIMVSQTVIDSSILNRLATDLVENNYKQEFEQTADVIMGIKNIISENLKGNPRQAKRFLNTFLTKRKLANIYYPDKPINEKILAKLLVLQKIDPDLFIQLNEWNKKFISINDGYKKMKDSVTSEEEDVSSEYSQWKKPNIIKWINSEVLTQM